MVVEDQIYSQDLIGQRSISWSNLGRRRWNGQPTTLDRVAVVRTGWCNGTMAGLTRVSGAAATEPIPRRGLALRGQRETANSPTRSLRSRGGRKVACDGGRLASFFGGGMSSWWWSSGDETRSGDSGTIPSSTMSGWWPPGELVVARWLRANGPGF
jgi:hypothetical protein